MRQPQDMAEFVHEQILKLNFCKAAHFDILSLPVTAVIARAVDAHVGAGQDFGIRLTLLLVIGAGAAGRAVGDIVINSDSLDKDIGIGHLVNIFNLHR